MFGSNIACRECNSESASVGCICYKEVYLLGSHCLITHIQHCRGIHYVIDLSSAEKLASNPIDLMKYLGEAKILSRFPKVGLYKNIKYCQPFILPDHSNQGNTTLASDLKLSLGPSAIITEPSQSRFLYYTNYHRMLGVENNQYYLYDILSKSFGEADGPNPDDYAEVVHRNAYGEVYYKENRNFYRYDDKTKRSIIVLSLPSSWRLHDYIFHGDILISMEYDLEFYIPAISLYTNRAQLLPTSSLLEMRLDSKTYAFCTKSEILDILSAENRIYVIQERRIGVCDSSMRLLYEIYFAYDSFYDYSDIKHQIYRNMIYIQCRYNYKIDLSPEIHPHKVRSDDHFKKNFNSRYTGINFMDKPMIIDLKYMIGLYIPTEAGVYCEIPYGRYLISLDPSEALVLYTISTQSFKEIMPLEGMKLGKVYSMLYHKGYVYALSHQFIHRYNIAMNRWKKMKTLPKYPYYFEDVEYENIPLIIDDWIYIMRRSDNYFDVYDIKTKEYHSNKFRLPGTALITAEVEGKIFIQYERFYQIYDKHFLLLEEDDTLAGYTFPHSRLNLSVNFYRGKLYYYDYTTKFIHYIDIKNKERGSEIIELRKTDLIAHT